MTAGAREKSKPGRTGQERPELEASIAQLNRRSQKQHLRAVQKKAAGRPRKRRGARQEPAMVRWRTQGDKPGTFQKQCGHGSGTNGNTGKKTRKPLLMPCAPWEGLCLSPA
jgi:hypothetical protein